MKKGHIFFISGVAGAGKGTVIKKLLEEKLENFELALSCKTREPRENEILWVDYNKLSTQEFQQAIKNWEFLEYNFVHNQSYYGVRYSDVIDNWINKGKIVLKEMEILWYQKFLETRPDLKKYYSYIFLDLPIEKIKERMITRWDCTEWKDFEMRIDSAKKESALKDIADYIIDADQTQEQVFSEVLEIITKKI
jgi:guanylate kinase